MDKVRLGRTGMVVSRLGFGGIPIQRDTEEEAIAVVKRCLDLGVTFIDTANGYSTSEERIGKAIAGRRDKVVIATKSGGRNRADVENHFKLSLERLKTDYIDLYQFHGVNNTKHLDTILEDGGLMSVVEEAKKAGKIRHIGITSHQIDIARKAVATDRFETLMFPFNFITHEAADDLIPLARKHDVGFIAMKPLAGGMLYSVSIAFKYLFQFPDILPIPGIEKLREIEEIVGVLNGPLAMTATEEQEMARLRQELGRKFCHRCDYCQPCTVGIPISTVLTSPSFAKRMPPERFLGMVDKAMAAVANCSDCGECEKRCPYELPIRQLIKEQLEWYQALKKRYEVKT
jgi:aryl-alcohol dehydrogenase-like predicted oxidoreductase